MRRKQLGYIDIPRGFFETVTILACVGVLALLGVGGYAAYWLISHLRFV